MKKGFTLIELLAVIVVLAIIALIAVPVVLNIINEAKESSLLRSAEFYLSAVDYTIANAFLYHGGLGNGQYPITPGGDLCKVNEIPCKAENILKVEVSGDKPTSGYIELNGGVISNVSLVLGERTIVQDTDGTLVYQPEQETKTIDDICTYQNNGVSEKTAGAKYTCKVDPNKEAYTFYVLTTPSTTDTSINLIMDRNICSDGTQTDANKEDKCLVAWQSSGLKTDGPSTAMAYLNQATSTWENIDNLNIEYDDEEENFTDFAINGKARLPYNSEVSGYDGTNGYLYEYIYEYRGEYTQTNTINGIYGYWTLSSADDVNTDNDAWYVGYYASHVYATDVDDNDGIGVRPVINLKL